MLGLQSTEQLSAELTRLTDRRAIFRSFPNGALPLAGILSMMDTEPTDVTNPGWWEKRYAERSGLTYASEGAGGSAFTLETAGTNDAAAAGDYDVGDVLYIWCQEGATGASDQQFRKNDVLRIAGVTWAGPVVGDLIVRVLATVADDATIDPENIKVEVLEDPGLAPADDAGTLGLTVRPIGSAYAEGAGTGTGIRRVAIRPYAYTQIFKQAFGLTRTALKIPMQYDGTGEYKEMAKDNLLDFMVGIESAILFGVPTERTEVDPLTGVDVPVRTTAGIFWWLRQWQLGNVANGGTFNYRTGAAATADTDDHKRIVSTWTGATDAAKLRTFDGYLERVFKLTNNKTFEKLAICGNGALKEINHALESKTTVYKMYPSEKAFGMNVSIYETPFGVIYFKSHPLFNHRAELNNDIVILDVQNLKLRPLTDSDVQLHKNIQAKSVDQRVDQWIGEFALEMKYPESAMWMRNVDLTA